MSFWQSPGQGNKAAQWQQRDRQHTAEILTANTNLLNTLKEAQEFFQQLQAPGAIVASAETAIREPAPGISKKNG